MDDQTKKDFLVVLQALSKSPGLATRQEYDAVMQDRPAKFNEEHVGFRRDSGDSDTSCGNCFHYYVSQAAGRKVCEIFRPKDDSNVEPEDRCAFWSKDGKDLPLLKS